MIPYFCILICPIIVRMLTKNEDKTRNTLFIVLVLFLSLRSLQVGGDLANYERYYRIYADLDLLSALKYSRWEPGFVLLNKICAFISNGNFRFFLVVCAIIFSYFWARIVWRFSKDQCITWYSFIAFGFLLYPISGIRASLAMAIGLHSIEYILDEDPMNRKKLIKFICLVFFASMMHYTSVIYLLALPFCRMKKDTKHYILIITIGIVLYFTGKKIVNFLAANFYTSEVGKITADGGYGMLFTIIALIILGIIICPPSRRTVKFDRYLGLLELAMLSQIITLHYAMWARITEFVFVFVFFFIPEILSYVEKRSRIIIIACMFMMLLIPYVRFLQADMGDLVPYTFLWQ